LNRTFCRQTRFFSGWKKEPLDQSKVPPCLLARVRERNFEEDPHPGADDLVVGAARFDVPTDDGELLGGGGEEAGEEEDGGGAGTIGSF
jgi:hypothetical protein